MSTQLQIRRDTEAINAVFVGAEGEITYATDTKLLRIHDGITPGGKVLAKDTDANKTGQVATLEPVVGSDTDYTLNLNGIEIDFAKSWRVYVQVVGRPTASASQLAMINPPPGSNYVNQTVSGDSSVADRLGVAAPLLANRAKLSVEALNSLDFQAGIYELSCHTAGAGLNYYFINAYANRQTGIVQNELATETFTANSNTFGERNIVLGGGEYGFNVRMTCATAPTQTDEVRYFNQITETPAMPLSGYVGIFSSAVRSYTVEQRYITASPPYDLGDGEIHGMLYLVVKKSDNSIVGHWAGRTPPWIYNGANKATADLYVDGVAHIWQRPSATIEDIRNGEIPGKVSVPLTTAIKNTDMAAIPQPFQFADPNDEYKVILADPMDECIMCMLDELNHGNKGIIQEIVDSRGFTIDAEPLSRAAPPGVAAHRITF